MTGLKSCVILVLCGVCLICTGCSGYWIPTPTPDPYQLEAEYRAEEYVISEYYNLTGQTEKEANRLMLQGLLLSKSGRYAESREYFSRLTSLVPNNPDAWYYLGMSEYHLNQWDNAMNAFNKSLEADPDYAWGYYGLSLVYYQQGDIWKQSEAISRAQEIEKSTSGLDDQEQDTPAEPHQRTPLGAVTVILGISGARLWFGYKKQISIMNKENFGEI
ncbi:MAG: tetratricopeptide repeat protein [Methanomicrobiales archaeon]|nr:tetratricopeptide repeat protein [Methanomicrobiales archaeon]